MFQFLKHHKASRENPKNLCSLTGKPYGGKFCVPHERMEEFLRLLGPGELTQDGVALVPQSNGRVMRQHTIDLDFDMHEEYEISVEAYLGFFRALVENIKDEEVQAVVLIPPEPYYKKREYWHTGVHGFLCVDRPVTKIEALAFRQANLGLIDRFFGDVPSAVGAEKIWDQGICQWNTGTTLAYTVKPGANGAKRPEILIMKQGGKIEYKMPEEVRELMKNPDHRFETLRMLYKDALCGEKANLPATKKRKKPPAGGRPAKRTKTEPDNAPGLAQSPRIRIENVDGFQGDYFLRWAKGRGWGSSIPVERDDWKLVVTYFAGCGYSPQQYGAKLTDLFDPEGRYPSQENENMMRKIAVEFDPVLRVRRATIERILARVFPHQWVSKRLWKPKKKYTHYGEYAKFGYGTGAHELSEFQRFVAETTSFVIDIGRYTYAFQDSTTDDQGNVYLSKNTVFTDKAPYSGAETFQVLIKPTSEDYVNYIKKNVRPKGRKKSEEEVKRQKLCDQICAELAGVETAEERARLVQQTLQMDELEPTYRRTSDLVKLFSERLQIRRYIRSDFHPYLYDDPTSDQVLNTWAGFPLQRYKAKRSVDVKKTRIWELFTTILSNRDEEVREYLFDWLGFKLQHPDRKFGRGRIWILKSVKQGCGKSSFYYFLQALMGVHNCAMVSTLKAMLHDFNSHLSSKLVIFIDDIDCATNKQTGELKGRITQEFVQYTEKNKMPITMRCCEEYICTSNCKTPLYTASEDRRQLYLPINGEYAAKSNPTSLRFFEDLYAEFKCNDTMKAWFDWLSGRDISKVSGHQSTDPKACVEIFREQASNCMRLPHKWLGEFFAMEDFIVKFKKRLEHQWFEGMDMTMGRKGNSVLMLVDHAYTVYSRWVKHDCPRSKPGSKNDFLDALKEMGIKPNKTLFLGQKRRNVLRFMEKKINKGLVDAYGQEAQAWPGDAEFKWLKEQLDNPDSVLGPRMCAFRDPAKDAMEEDEEGED